jgi:hypothetical protein
MNEDNTSILNQPYRQLELDLRGTASAVTYSNIYAGASGQTLSVTAGDSLAWNTGVTSAKWANSPYNYDTIAIGDCSLTGANKVLSVKGDANFEGDIKFQGKSLSKVLDNIEQRLGILHPNPELEERWDELKELSERYRKLEEEILEKERMWAIIKK